MSPFEQLAAQLRQAREQIPSSQLVEAANASEQIRHTLATIDSEQDDARQAQQCADKLAELVEQARQAGASIQAKVEKYLALVGDASGPSAPIAPTASEPQRRATVASTTRFVTASDGSQYPDAAAPVVDVMPRRVREGTAGEKTVGFVDGEIGQQFASGNDLVWSPEIHRRAQKVGIHPRFALFVSTHVELKVATMMIQRGQRYSELVINHVPCGSRPDQPPGCDQALEWYLPRGYTLTVHGTTQDGTPVTRTYKGKA